MAENKREVRIGHTGGDNTLKITDKEPGTGALTVKVNVDVSEALTGLKAVQREAREATKALRELEAAQSSVKDSECFRCGGKGFISLGEGVRGIAKCAYCKK